MAVKGMSLKRFYFVVILLSCNCFFLSCEMLCEKIKKIIGIGNKTTTVKESDGNIGMGDTTQTKIDTTHGTTNVKESDGNIGMGTNTTQTKVIDPNVEESKKNIIGMGNTTETIINNPNVKESIDRLKDINDEEEEKVYKCVIVSAVNCNVGKTSIVDVATGQEFNEGYKATIIALNSYVSVIVNDMTIKLTLLDTSSQEQYQSLLKLTYKDSNAFIFVYDISERNSLNSLKEGINNAKENTNEDTLFFLLGNKLDLAESRQVEQKEAQKFAHDNGLIFLGECSAKTDKYCPSQNLPYKEEPIKENDTHTNLKGIFKAVAHNIHIKNRSKFFLS